MNTHETKSGRTELVFILDKSGSMSGLESDTIGGLQRHAQKTAGGPGSGNDHHGAL